MFVQSLNPDLVTVILTAGEAGQLSDALFESLDNYIGIEDQPECSFIETASALLHVCSEHAALLSDQPVPPVH